MEIVAVLVCVLIVVWVFAPRRPPEICSKCGTPKTDWYEGMGAGFWACKNCH
jgi:ribosomal protein L37AE/L43A